MHHGILLFAHGARDPAWAQPFELTRDRLRSRLAGPSATLSGQPGTSVGLAYLEFMRPSLMEAGAQMAASGCRHVTVVPLFLGAGGHVRKDLPMLLAQLQTDHPQVNWRLAPAVGETDTVVNAMAQAAAELACAEGLISGVGDTGPQS